MLAGFVHALTLPYGWRPGGSWTVAGLLSAIEKGGSVDVTKRILGPPLASVTQRWTVPEAPPNENGPGHAWVHVWEKRKGDPTSAYVRVQVGKGGTALNAGLYALGVAVGRCLRSGVPVATVHKDLCGITSELYADGGRLVYEATSAADAVAQTLASIYGVGEPRADSVADVAG